MSKITNFFEGWGQLKQKVNISFDKFLELYKFYGAVVDIVKGELDKSNENIQTLIGQIFAFTTSLPFIYWNDEDNCECYAIVNPNNETALEPTILCNVSDGYLTALKRALELLTK